MVAADSRPARSSALRLILLGPPGSGKGTQATLLSSRLEVPSISTGEMLREAVAEGSALGRRVKETMESGKLVDDETMAEVVAERLSRPDARDGFILDGFPRTVRQADMLDDLLARRDARVHCVLRIIVPKERLVERMLARGREDDRSEVFGQRLEVYRRQTEPLVEHYRRRGLLRQVDGDQTVEQVAEAIGAVLDGDA